MIHYYISFLKVKYTLLRKKGNDMANIAILGFGVVGSGVAEVLTQNADLIEARIHQKLNIKYILDLRDFPDSPFGSLVTHDFNVILNDPEVTIVAEMMGGSHPAYDFSLACLKAGKSVITSNKEVVANFGVELMAAAEENNVRYLFEASVGGGIPIIRPLANDLSANSVRSIDGILNGTTNYILTKMQTENSAFAEALSEAQKKGYAEANPTADVEGIDAARKIVILAALAFGKLVSPDMIYREGISKITTADFNIAKQLGYSIKLIAHTERIGDKILAMVSPRLVPLSNPLHSVEDVFNGIMVDTDMLGTAMFYGRGAGKLPTASAVVSDIIDAAKAPSFDDSFPAFEAANNQNIVPFETYSCKNMIILNKAAESKAEGIGGEKSILDDKLVLITNVLSEKVMKQVLAELGDDVISRIRLL